MWQPVLWNVLTERKISPQYQFAWVLSELTYLFNWTEEDVQLLKDYSTEIIKMCDIYQWSRVRQLQMEDEMAEDGLESLCDLHASSGAD